MHFRSGAPTLLLLLCLLEVRGQERGYLREALGALDLPLGANDEPQLQKNHTGILIAKLLRAVHCAERTGTSQDVCNKVRATPVLMLSHYMIIMYSFLPAYSKKHACYGWNVSECGGLKSLTSAGHSC